MNQAIGYELSTMADFSLSLSRLLAAFRSGNLPAQGEVLGRYQPWLLLLARVQIDSQFQGKFDPSDVVQQTLLEAYRDFGQFRGGTEAELMAWLRQILAHVLAHEIRRYRGTQQRDLSREVSLEQALAQSSQRLGEVLAGSQSSPSQQAARHEGEMLLAEVLARLPEDYREVIVLRNLEGLPHEEIARRMGRSAGAVRMLWVRALDRLRQELQAP
jgi:RNA polymerase sigma-70 factor (ECF subfamily)